MLRFLGPHHLFGQIIIEYYLRKNLYRANWWPVQHLFYFFFKYIFLIDVYFPTSSYHLYWKGKFSKINRQDIFHRIPDLSIKETTNSRKVFKVQIRAIQKLQLWSSKCIVLKVLKKSADWLIQFFFALAYRQQLWLSLFNSLIKFVSQII